jgi:hypothetical protein
VGKHHPVQGLRSHKFEGVEVKQHIHWIAKSLPFSSTSQLKHWFSAGSIYVKYVGFTNIVFF